MKNKTIYSIIAAGMFAFIFSALSMAETQNNITLSSYKPNAVPIKYSFSGATPSQVSFSDNGAGGTFLFGWNGSVQQAQDNMVIPNSEYSYGGIYTLSYVPPATLLDGQVQSVTIYANGQPLSSKLSSLSYAIQLGNIGPNNAVVYLWNAPEYSTNNSYGPYPLGSPVAMKGYLLYMGTNGQLTPWSNQSLTLYSNFGTISSSNVITQADGSFLYTFIPTVITNGGTVACTLGANQNTTSSNAASTNALNSISGTTIPLSLG